MYKKEDSVKLVEEAVFRAMDMSGPTNGAEGMDPVELAAETIDLWEEGFLTGPVAILRLLRLQRKCATTPQVAQVLGYIEQIAQNMSDAEQEPEYAHIVGNYAFRVVEVKQRPSGYAQFSGMFGIECRVVTPTGMYPYAYQSRGDAEMAMKNVVKDFDDTIYLVNFSSERNPVSRARVFGL